MPYRIDPVELEEMRQTQRIERRYLAALTRHPDCRDPSHPGCDRCVDSDDDDDSSDDQ